MFLYVLMKGKCGVLVFESSYTELFLISFIFWGLFFRLNIFSWEENKEREGGRYKETETCLLCVSWLHSYWIKTTGKSSLLIDPCNQWSKCAVHNHDVLAMRSASYHIDKRHCSSTVVFQSNTGMQSELHVCPTSSVECFHSTEWKRWAFEAELLSITTGTVVLQKTVDISPKKTFNLKNVFIWKNIVLVVVVVIVIVFDVMLN